MTPDVRVRALLRPATPAEVTEGLERNPGSGRLVEQGWIPAWFELDVDVDGSRAEHRFSLVWRDPATSAGDLAEEELRHGLEDALASLRDFEGVDIEPDELPAAAIALTSIAAEPWDSPDAAALRDGLVAELEGRYGAGTEPGVRPSAADIAVLLVARTGGEALGCGALRPVEPGTVEIKRMYVAPTARRLGLGARLLAALEAEAATLGVTRIVLETGPRQPEAIALYERAGYTPIQCWGERAPDAPSRCFERRL
jgi:putative acetyltransferase